jgi:hypothetical protein
MKKLLLTTAIAGLMIGSAHAGCTTNYAKPKMVVCLMNKCDKTFEYTTCSTDHIGWTTYGNGVTVWRDQGRIMKIKQGYLTVPRSQWKTLVIKPE